MEETKNFFKSWVLVLVSLCYSYFIASKVPKGILRFLSLIPIFSLFTILPLSLSRPIPCVIFSGFITWIANFKLLQYAFNHGIHGPLSTSRSLLSFIFLAALPIKAKSGSQRVKGSFGNSPKKVVVPLNYWSKCGLFVISDVVYNNHSKSVIVLCCLMYLFIDIAFGVCDVLVGSILGLELCPPSDEPYLSTSLQEFWGRRWNLMISDALRHTIYKPMQSTSVKYLGRRWATVPGVIASFVVSGLMHELIYYYVTRVTPTWEVTWFFVLHGICVILEMFVKIGLGQKWKLHWAISGPLTVGFVMATAHWLFFPQVIRNQVDVRATEDIMSFGKFLKELIFVE